MIGRRQRRLELGPEQLEQMRALLEAVPQQAKVHRQWDTDAGQAFLSQAAELYQQGFPTRWMARDLGMNERVLNQLINAYRRRRVNKP